jgi:hypothetical protein
VLTGTYKIFYGASASAPTNSATTRALPSNRFTNAGNTFILNTASSAPTSSTESGISGEVRVDNNYLYIYANLKWHRFPAALWN